MKSKYLVINHKGEEAVIVFSPFLRHRDMAGNFEVRSAGFCEINGDGHLVVSGRSDELKCYSRPEDVKLLSRHLYGGGILSKDIQTNRLLNVYDGIK